MRQHSRLFTTSGATCTTPPSPPPPKRTHRIIQKTCTDMSRLYERIQIKSSLDGTHGVQ